MIRKSGEGRVEIREKMLGGEGVVRVEHIFSKEEMRANSRLCGKLTVPPGASIGMHAHKDEDEVYIIARGNGVVVSPDGEYPVSAGDATLTLGGESHGIRNTGNEDLEIIAVIMCY